MTNTETHPSPGMRSHWPVIPAIRLLWTIMTPLGLPVEPLVYITTARSEGWGFTITLPTARQTKLYCICDTFQPQIWLRITTKVRKIHTIVRQHAQLLYGLHAVDGQSRWVAFCAHFLLVHVDHMLQFWNLWKHILDRKKKKPPSQQGPRRFGEDHAWSCVLPHVYFVICFIHSSMQLHTKNTCIFLVVSQYGNLWLSYCVTFAYLQ